jgi:single-stranded DNA-binding protein
MSLNRVELVGGLVRQPEVSTTPGGHTLWRATIAVNGTRYDSQAQAQVVKTAYVTISAAGTLADRIVEIGPVQGDEVHVLGEITQHEVEKPDGKTERKTGVEILVLTPVRMRHVARQQAANPPW